MTGPLRLGQHRQLHPGREHGPEAGAEQDDGERAPLEQGRRQPQRAQPAGVDHHVEVDVTEPVEGVREVVPHAGEVAGAAGAGEAGEEQPAVAVGLGQGEALVDDGFAEVPPVAVRLGDAQQPLAAGGSPGQVAGEHGLRGARVGVDEQHRPRPGEGQSDGQRRHARRAAARGQDEDGHLSGPRPGRRSSAPARPAGRRSAPAAGRRRR